MSEIDVLLIEPMFAHKEKDVFIRDQAEFYSGSPIAIREPIAAEYIAAFLEKKGISVDVIQQTTIDDELIKHIENKKPKMLAISIHSTSMVPRVLSLLNLCKEKFPNVVVICGGNHPTCSPEIINEDCIDYVARGEGEQTLYELANAILNRQTPFVEEIKGISFKKDNKIIHNPPRERFNFLESPWPIRKRKILETIKCAPLCYPSPPKQKCAAQIAYSRGCPYRCEFCVSPMVFQGPVIYRDVMDVINEIQYLMKTFGTNFLFFTDLTFNSNIPKAIDLTKEIKDKGVHINWFAYCSMHMNETLAKSMHEAGCTRIGSGAESFVDEILNIYKSQQNLKMIKDTLKLIDNFGILNRVYIMIGYPEETEGMLDETLNIMKNLPIDQPRLAFITPFPGTQFFEDTKSNLITKSPENFTGDFPVLRNNNISPEDYLNYRNTMINNFYNSDEYASHVIDKVIRFPYLLESFDYFIEYLKDKKILKSQSYIDLKKELNTGVI